MSESADIESWIKRQKKENEELSLKIDKLLNEERILVEKRERLEEQLDLKRQEHEKKKNEKNQDPHKGPSNKENENDAERREKKLDDWLKNKILSLILDEDRPDDISDIEEQLNKTMVIGSVLIRYLSNVGDGEWEAFEKADPNEAYFKISKETTFTDLKNTACMFWKIEEPQFIGLRSSNYALLDLHMNKNVEETILKLRMAPEFWLFKINKFSKKTFTELKDCFIDSNTASNFRISEDNRKPVNSGGGFGDSVNRKNFEKIKGVYKGLEKYDKKLIKPATVKLEQEKIISLEFSFKTCFACLIIFIFTLAILFIRRSVTDDYFIQSSLNIELKQGINGINFFEISSLNNLHGYIKDSFGPTVFKNKTSTVSSALITRYKIPGKIRIRQVKTKEVTCENKKSWNIKNIVCYGENYLTDKYKEDNTTSNNDAFLFHSSSSGPDLIIGDITNYDTSGYYKDFEPSMDLSDFIKDYEELEKNNWIDKSTRAVFINMNLFLPNTDQFVAVYILVEISVSGVILPSRLSSRVLISDFYTNSDTDKTMLALEVIRLLISLFVLFVYIKVGLKKNKDGNREGYNWIKPENLLNLFIFVFIITCFAFSFYVNKDAKEIIEDEGYVDLGDTFFYYYTSLLLNAWLLIFSFFRIIITLKFSSTINRNLHALELSTKSFMYFMLFLLPIIICLSLITSNMFGAYLYTYSSAKRVAISNILFTMGEGDVDKFFKISEAWTIGYLIIYFLIIMFFLYSSFIGILIDSYRIADLYHEEMTKLKKNDPDYVAWKVWLFDDCKRCRRKKVDEEV